MLRIFGLRLSEVAAIGLLMAISAGAQQERAGVAAPAAPVPPQIFSAKKIFVSNGGADSGLFPHPFSGTPERAYRLGRAVDKPEVQTVLLSGTGMPTCAILETLE